MKIGVIFGTPSIEHLGSCVSGTHVSNVLSQKHEVRRILIEMSGEWKITKRMFSYRNKKQNELFYNSAINLGIPHWKNVDLNKIAETLKNLDIVLPITHGPYGEGGILQGFLETIGIKYAGPRIETCLLTQNKDLIKKLCLLENIPISPFLSFSQNHWQLEKNKLLEKIQKEIRFPLFVKPNDGGSSIGINKVRDIFKLPEAINTALQYSNRVIIEQSVEGSEIECAVIGNNEPIVAENIGEVEASNEFYDLEAKYFKPSKIHIPPRNIDRKTTKIVRDFAFRIYKIARGNGFSRVDFIVEKESGVPYLIEFTAIPGCTEYSLFPKLFIESGWKEIDLWEKIINYGFEYYQNQS